MISGWPTIRPDVNSALGACIPVPLPASRRSTHFKPSGILKSRQRNNGLRGALAIE
jgi:hypothetical protein